MKYKIRYESRCIKYLRKLDKAAQLRILKAINELPIEVVKKCFRDKKFFEKEVDLSKINETEFGFNGLCACQTIRDLANELIYYNYVLTKKELEFKIKNGCFK